MSFDDLPQKKPLGITVGESLELHSVSELEQRVEALEAEILRVKAAIADKKASKSAADAFFRN